MYHINQAGNYMRETSWAMIPLAFILDSPLLPVSAIAPFFGPVHLVSAQWILVDPSLHGCHSSLQE